MSSANATPPPTDTSAADSLSVSVVVYRLDRTELARTLQTLSNCVQALENTAVTLTLVDNSEGSELAAALAELASVAGFPAARVISGHGNVGYGAGHNMAIVTSRAFAHLVLNPDVELDWDALRAGLRTLCSNGVVLVGAVGRDANGTPGYLSKRMPSVLTFLLRGFAPVWLKQCFGKRLAHYEYRDLPADHVSDVVLVSGAFMLCRTAALQAVAGFDERYFLHFEDLDLSLRLHTQGRVVSDPGVTLIHHGGHSAKKGLRHILMFGRSAFRFFNTHGWRLF